MSALGTVVAQTVAIVSGVWYVQRKGRAPMVESFDQLRIPVHLAPVDVELLVHANPFARLLIKFAGRQQSTDSPVHVGF